MMKNPNEVYTEAVKELSEEGTSWNNPGEFPTFSADVNSEKSANVVVTKEDRIEEIRKLNQDVDGSLVPEYFESDLFDKLGEKNLDITAIKPVQEQLLAIPEQSKETFLSLVDTFDRKDNWKPHFQAVLNNFTNGKFDDLIQSVSEDNSNNINLAMLDRVMTHKENYLGITNVDELDNVENIIDEKIDEAVENGDAKQFKNFALLKKYNLSLDEAKILVEKYAYKIEDVNVDKYADMEEFLTELRAIVSAETPEEFSGLLDSSKERPIQNFPDFQINAQRMYAESFNNDLFSTKNAESYVEDGTQIVDAGTDFKMIVRSEGAFSDRKQDDNHAARWNRPSRLNASFSNSLISNERLLYYGMTRAAEQAPSVTYGFSDLDEDAIVENALGDDATMHKRKITLDVSSYGDFRTISPTTFDGCGQRYMTVGDMMDDGSRAIHTETVLTRFYKNENGEEVRRQPSYIVYVKTKESYHEDPLYEESKKTARDFNIPVVMIDMKKVLSSERQKIEQSKEELAQDWTVDKTMDIVQSWSNNAIIQLRSDAAELVDEYFPEEIDGKNPMVDFITEQMKNALDDKKQELFDKLMVLNAKKRVVPATFLVRLQHAYPNLSAKIEEYGKELLGVTVNDQPSESEWYVATHQKMDECYRVCEEYGLPITDEILTTRSSKELHESIEICEKAGIRLTEELALIRPYELENTINVCHNNDLPLTPTLLTQNHYTLDRKISACKKGEIELSVDMLEKTLDEINAIAEENKKAMQPSVNLNDTEGFGDFSADDWSDESWDDWN